MILKTRQSFRHQIILSLFVYFIILSFQYFIILSFLYFYPFSTDLSRMLPQDLINLQVSKTIGLFLSGRGGDCNQLILCRLISKRTVSSYFMELGMGRGWYCYLHGNDSCYGITLQITLQHLIYKENHSRGFKGIGQINCKKIVSQYLFTINPSLRICYIF